DELREWTSPLGGSTAAHIQHYLAGLRLHQQNAVYPEIPGNTADYSVQDYTNRELQVIDAAARQAGCDYPGLLALVLAVKHRELSATDPDNRENVEALYTQIQVIYAPLAERLGQQELAERMRNDAFRLYDPDGYMDTRERYREALGLTHTQA